MLGLKLGLALPPVPTRESIAAWVPREKHPLLRDDRVKGERHRWRVPFIARGARGPVGGHAKVLGCMYSWNDERSYGYAFMRRWSLFGIVGFAYADDEAGRWKRSRPRFQVSWCRVEFRVRPASHY